MMHRLLTLAIAFLPAVSAADAYLASAQAKLELIEGSKAKRGSVIFFSLQEINSWAKYMVPTIVPEGIRNQRVTLATDSGTAYALMDFMKMRHAQGKTAGWMERLLQGERPVTIAIRMQSGAGRCKVELTRVEISGVAATGSVLDFMVKTFFLPLYPNAHINETFEIGYNIDRMDIGPAGVRVTIKK
jgi:hypothetical protein